VLNHSLFGDIDLKLVVFYQLVILDHILHCQHNLALLNRPLDSHHRWVLTGTVIRILGIEDLSLQVVFGANEK
jgi:hypothetical protein